VPGYKLVSDLGCGLLPVDEKEVEERKKAYAGLIDLLESFARDTDGTLAIKDGIGKCELENESSMKNNRPPQKQP